MARSIKEPRPQRHFSQNTPHLLVLELAMCSRRHVCYIYTKCGHAYTMPEEIIKCDSDKCIFSPNHPPTCSGPTCKRTCWQYRQPSQQYSPQIAEFCPACAQQGRR